MLLSIRILDMKGGIKELEKETHHKHVLPVKASCRSTSLSAPLALSSSSSSTPLRSSARRSFSAWVKSTWTPSPPTSCWVGKTSKRIIISNLLQWWPSGLEVCLFLELETNIFLLEKQTVYRLAPSHAISPGTTFGLTWTLTYLNVSLDKVLLFFLAFEISTVAAFKLLPFSLLMAYFKWFCPAVRHLFTCQIKRT